MSNTLRIALAQFDFPGRRGRAERRTHRRDDRRGARRARRRPGAVPRAGASAAIRRKTCCCARLSSRLRAALQQVAARHPGHRRGGRLAAGGRQRGLQRRQRAARWRGRDDLPQARAAQLRGVRRAPLFRRRSRWRRLRVRGQGRAGGPGDLRGPVVPRTAGGNRDGRRAAGAGAECLAVRARQARAARCAVGAARAARPASRWPTSTWSAARMRWCSTAPRCWPMATAWCIRPRARSRTIGWSPISIRRRASSAPLQWRQDGDESRDALAWRAVVRGTRDYCLQERFREGVAGPVRRHRFGAGAGDRGRCAGRGERHRGAPAVALHRRPVQ